VIVITKEEYKGVMHRDRISLRVVFDSKCNIADNHLGRCEDDATEDDATRVVDYVSLRGGGAFKTNQ
jgi:hypothetical protein